MTNKETGAQIDLEFIQTCLRHAGKLALDQWGKVTASLKSDLTPVTAVDRQVEDFVIEQIAARYPSHRILSEEGGALRDGEDFTWVIDPIDGTRAFASGLPIWGVSIGVLQGSQPHAGGFYLPATNELFWGTCQAAFYNEQKLAPLSPPDLSSPLVFLAVPSDFHLNYNISISAHPFHGQHRGPPGLHRSWICCRRAHPPVQPVGPCWHPAPSGGSGDWRHLPVWRTIPARRPAGRAKGPRTGPGRPSANRGAGTRCHPANLKWHPQKEKTCESKTPPKGKRTEAAVLAVLVLLLCALCAVGGYALTTRRAAQAPTSTLAPVITLADPTQTGAPQLSPTQPGPAAEILAPAATLPPIPLATSRAVTADIDGSDVSNEPGAKGRPDDYEPFCLVKRSRGRVKSSS